MGVQVDMKVVRIGIYRRGEDLHEALARVGISLEGSVVPVRREMQVLGQTEDVEVVSTTVGGLGFPNGAERSKWEGAGLIQGHDLCLGEMLVRYLLEYGDELKSGEEIYPAMYPIGAGDEMVLCRLFARRRLNGTLWLEVEIDDTKKGYPPKTRVMFCRHLK